MSAFLGPIHYRMYERIITLDEITAEFISAAKENWPELSLDAYLTEEHPPSKA